MAIEAVSDIVLVAKSAFEDNTGAGGSGATGLAVVDFGADGKSIASVTVSAASIVAGSKVSAHIHVAASADHTADEHVVEEIDIMAGNIQAGVGFTVYAKTRNKALIGQWNVVYTWS